MLNEKFKAIFLMLLVVFIWGVSFLSIKTVVTIVPPMSQGLIRFFIASLILYFAKMKICPNEKIQKSDYKYFFMIGSVGIALYFYFENSSMLYLPASIAGILIATLPIFIMISESIVYKISLEKYKLFGVLMSFVGVYLILSNQCIIESNDFGKLYIGLGMMLGAIGSWVIYSIIMKKLSGNYSSVTITYYQSVIGTICFLPFVFREKIIWNQVNIIIVGNMLFLSIVCSAFAFLLYNYVVGIMGPGQSSIYLNLMPLVTMLASIIVLREQVTFMQVIGSFIVIFAVYIVENITKFEFIKKIRI